MKNPDIDPDLAETVFLVAAAVLVGILVYFRFFH